MAYRVSKATFAALVEQALAELPPPFAEFLEQVPLEIKDRPTRQQLRSVGLQDNQLLLGLYVGRPQTQRSVLDDPALPDIIYIFQQDVELACATKQQLIDEVRTTVLHEIGHHFGMSEQDLDQLGYG